MNNVNIDPFGKVFVQTVYFDTHFGDTGVFIGNGKIEVFLILTGMNHFRIVPTSSSDIIRVGSIRALHYTAIPHHTSISIKPLKITHSDRTVETQLVAVSNERSIIITGHQSGRIL